MASINVTYAEVTSAAGRLNSAQQNMMDQVSQLKAMIDNLVQSGFKTELASGKFAASYDQWNNGARNVLEGLGGMKSFLDQVVAKHQELDSSLGSSLG
ncbi:WXG100 family type VII secretion target [Kineosporia sp. R_H_3]|uniref:WXG100 family type VII secretion target n=1 Tax=Kineosporia sp. R_H_3 TaxID=1961848 RepID=UPI000B4C0409|nr:WXG100 family type VII secretion target [Kineosporia sp. R_H_3]